MKPIENLFFISAMLVFVGSIAGCASSGASKDTLTGKQNATLGAMDAKEPVKTDDIVHYDVEDTGLWYKDAQVPEIHYSDSGYHRDTSDVIPEGLWFMPKDAEEGATCLKWKKVTAREFFSTHKTTCWAPPEQWCYPTINAALPACNPDRSLCCLLEGCMPCGWVEDSHHPSAVDSRKCNELKSKMYADQWMVCQEW